MDEELETLRKQNERLRLAMGNVPLPGRQTKIEDFRKRMDRWMQEHYYPAMEGDRG